MFLGEGRLCLGEPEDSKFESLVCLGNGFACLGEPLRLGEGRLRLGELVTVLRPMFMACLGLVSWPGL